MKLFAACLEAQREDPISRRMLQGARLTRDTSVLSVFSRKNPWGIRPETLWKTVGFPLPPFVPGFSSAADFIEKGRDRDKLKQMVDLGKFLLVIGGVIAILGAVLMLAGRFHLPIGRLPGDVVYRSRNTVVYFPIVTSLVLSAILSLIFWLISRSRH